MNTIPHCGELITSLLPSSPSFCERDFTLVLAEFYHRCAIYTPWEQTEKQNIDNVMNTICSAGAFIPQGVTEGDSFHITWKPFETLPAVSDMIKSFNFDHVAEKYLNEWVRQKFIIFRNSLIKQGDEYYRLLLNLFFMGIKIDTSAPALRSLPVMINQWLSVLHIDYSAYQYSINIKNEKRLSEFTISMAVSVKTETDSKKIPLSKCKDKNVLQTPIALSNYLPEIRKLIECDSVLLSEKRLILFIDSAAALLTRLGITVNLPKTLAKVLKPRLVVKKDSTGGSLVRYLDLDTLQDFKWKIAIGDEVISIEEFERILNEKREIISFKNGYVKIEPKELSYLLKRAKQAPPTVNDFIKAHITGNSVMAFDEREKINNLFRESDFPVPSLLNAQLRPYQKRGYDWICSLLYSGFGCILADDMGLGKTVQSIAVMLRLKEEGLTANGCFVVAPAALIHNWENELTRFAPSLRFTRYHGKDCLFFLVRQRP